MPTYEYVCRDCGEHLEVVQSFKDDPLSTCGLCGGELRKVFSAAGIIFKGSGYYVTDTREQKTAGKAGASKSEESAKESSDSGKDTGKDAGKETPKAAEGGTSQASGKQSSDAKSA